MEGVCLTQTETLKPLWSPSCSQLRLGTIAAATAVAVGDQTGVLPPWTFPFCGHSPPARVWLEEGEEIWGVMGGDSFVLQIIFQSYQACPINTSQKCRAGPGGWLGGCAVRMSPGRTWCGNPLQPCVLARPGFAVSGVVLVLSHGPKRRSSSCKSNFAF